MRFSLADTQQAEDVAAFIATAQGPYAGVILNVSIKNTVPERSAAALMSACAALPPD